MQNAKAADLGGKESKTGKKRNKEKRKGKGTASTKQKTQKQKGKSVKKEKSASADEKKDRKRSNKGSELSDRSRKLSFDSFSRTSTFSDDVTFSDSAV